MISRRAFLTTTTKIGLLAGCPLAYSGAIRDAFTASIIGANGRIDDLIRTAPVARFWTSSINDGVACKICHDTDVSTKDYHQGRPAIVKCLLCARQCSISEGERGECNARINIDGKLRSLVYGRPVSINIDPIEKKPFYHFLPGSEALSLATSGCPLHCRFCQNWTISQAKPEDFDRPFVEPERICNSAIQRHTPIIAFTYNEPTVFMEYLSDIASLAEKSDLRSVMISCGFMNPEPLKEMCGFLDAIKIDLKGYSPDFYRNVCDAELQPVLNSIRTIAKSRVHLEIVNLVVPTLNDSSKMMEGLIDWIAGEVGPDVPVHFTRFHPDYRLLNLPPTPVATLEKFRDRAMSRGLHYAYIGNVPGHEGNNTLCPRCGKTIIQRRSFFLEKMYIENGCCKFCGEKIAGVWT
ncbi:MAG: AmmeMemoRadiSam system radical SAM enzyme [Acidobacteriota bacterium]